MHAPVHQKVGSRQVFAIAGPAMITNVTTPLIGVVSTTAIGRLDDAHLEVAGLGTLVEDRR